MIVYFTWGFSYCKYSIIVYFGVCLWCNGNEKLSNRKIKSSLYSLNALSGVTSERCPTPRLYARAHIKVAAVASRWQRVGDLIGSGFEPYTSRTRSRRLTTSTCTIWPVKRYYNRNSCKIALCLLVKFNGNDIVHLHCSTVTSCVANFETCFNFAMINYILLSRLTLLSKARNNAKPKESSKFVFAAIALHISAAVVLESAIIVRTDWSIQMTGTRICCRLLAAWKTIL